MPDADRSNRGTRGVLAHVIARRYTSASEDIATDTLAYLLSHYREASEAFVAMARRLQPSLPDILDWQTQDSDAAVDTSRPDLVGRSAGRTRSLLVESKLWAGLTENQPTTYLRRLSADQPGALMFIVPDRRRSSVFGEVVRRCQADDELVPDHVDADAYCARIGQRVVAVTTWGNVLDELETALDHDVDGRADLRQLAGFCRYEDGQQILPFTSDELTGNIGQRMIDLVTIIGETMDRLVQLEGISASTVGRAWSSSTDYTGRYFLLRGWECLLHVNYWRWANEAPTPLWLQITDGSVRDGTMEPAFDELRQEMPRRLFETGGKLQVPLTIPVGVERDEIVIALTDQLKTLHDLFADGPALRDAASSV